MDIDSIYRLYFRDVFLFLQGLTHNETLAEELTQETFFKALDGLKDYDDRQDVRAWLFTVARNAYYSHCRRTKRTAPLEDAETAPTHAPDIAQLLVDQDAAFTVHQCLHTLDEPYKEVFSLRVFGELPFERIGLIFGHNAAWARVTYYRAKTQLKRCFPFHLTFPITAEHPRPKGAGVFSFCAQSCSPVLRESRQQKTALPKQSRKDTSETNQRLENWGARRAAFRPYSPDLDPKSPVFMRFSGFSLSVNP